jgi:hypothetical protein
VRSAYRDSRAPIPTQALKGDLYHPERSAPAIYKKLVEKLGQKARLQQTLVSAFASSPNWDEARARFDRMAMPDFIGGSILQPHNVRR